MTPLDGIRVVDLTSYIAGSYAAMMLADLGASVVKVEALDGDPFRELPGFLGWNRGKRSIAVDLKTADGRTIVERLATRGDVVMENMRPGVAERLGLGDAALRALNPRLIYCSVTAFGSTGPYADRPGFDPILQAMSGAMVYQGFVGPPQYIRIAVTDYYTASLGAQAVLAALFARERTGRGQRVETSLLHGAIALNSGAFVDYPGKPVVARDNPTYRLYQAGDGEWFFLACGNQSFWAKLSKAMGLEHLTDDPRFASWLLRLEHCDELLPILIEKFRSKPRAEWLALLAAHDIPAAPVQALAAFMQDPGVQAQDMIHEYDHPEVGRLRLMGQPMKITPDATRDPGPPPTLGQHTDEVLREVGYDEREIADLRARRIVDSRGKPPPRARASL
ncbi:MAG: formyl-CoA transferase [Candidatus Rokuibacteriota bacterium]|nr:MAG: formyl-CoA transferase [Candidatus Rokubacteria bacterium]